MSRERYESRHLACLVPTKDRPHKLRRLLESFCRQVPCGRILIIDGGDSVRDLVLSYADRLPIEYHACRPPGQIRQRNLGIALLDERTPLAAFFDDDIVLEPEAVKEIIAFWNRCEAVTAGVGFNIVNGPKEPQSWLRRVFGVTAPQPGRVLRSGFPTSISHLSRDIRSEWLCGGATVWRSAILREFQHRDIAGKWAIGEDIIFSYPIGKRYPLYVCAPARVRHEHEADYTKTLPHRFHGRTQTMSVMYFVELNADLSRAAFLWMILGTVLGRVVVGTATFERRHLEFALGQVQAVSQGMWALARGRSLTTVIEGSRPPAR